VTIDSKRSKAKVGNCTYPAPDRTNFAPNQHTSDPVMPEGDLGGRSGTLSDGRPLRVESWFREGTTLITVSFSVLDLEDADSGRLLRLVSPLLEEECVPAKWRRLGPTDAHTITDASGNAMYNLTFVVGEPDS
jgi:hypothetical protein